MLAILKNFSAHHEQLIINSAMFIALEITDGSLISGKDSNVFTTPFLESLVGFASGAFAQSEMEEKTDFIRIFKDVPTVLYCLLFSTVIFISTVLNYRLDAYYDAVLVTPLMTFGRPSMNINELVSYDANLFKLGLDATHYFLICILTFTSIYYYSIIGFTLYIFYFGILAVKNNYRSQKQQNTDKNIKFIFTVARFVAAHIIFLLFGSISGVKSIDNVTGILLNTFIFQCNDIILSAVQEECGEEVNTRVLCTFKLTKIANICVKSKGITLIRFSLNQK